MTTQVVCVVHRRVNAQEALGLVSAFVLESSHVPLSKSRCLMRSFGFAVRIAIDDVNRAGNRFPMGNPVTARFVSHHLLGRIAMKS